MAGGGCRGRGGCVPKLREREITAAAPLIRRPAMAEPPVAEVGTGGGGGVERRTLAIVGGRQSRGEETDRYRAVAIRAYNEL